MPPQHPETEGSYAARLAAERDRYQDCLNVHNLPDIFHYWSNRHVRPRLEALGFSSPNDMFRKYLGEHCGPGRNAPARFVSIGSGNCDLEIGMASHFRSADRPDFIIDCLDMNSAMLERGRAAAVEEGLGGCVNFILSDFNEWTPAHEYDAVIANQTLHHVLRLEDLFGKIKSCLKPDGSFIVSDMIGRNGHQRWPEALEIVHEFWRKLPPSYRFNRMLQRYEELYESWDCSSEGFEGIRSEDILPLLLEEFHFKLFFGYANVIDPFVDRAFGHNFDATAAWDRDFIDTIHRRDEQEMLSGRIKPTHMLAVMSKLPVSSMIVHEALTPRFCTRNAAASVSIPVSGNGPRPGAYDWTSWPHSPQRELEIACERLAGLKGEAANRTAWAMQIERDLQEKIAWGVQLGKQVEEWSAWGLQLEKQLEERTAWALQLEKRAEETAGEALRISNELADLNLQMEERTRWALSLQQETEDLKTHSLQLSKDLDRLAWARPFDQRFHASLHSIYRGIRWVRDRLFGRAGH